MRLLLAALVLAGAGFVGSGIAILRLRLRPAVPAAVLMLGGGICVVAGAVCDGLGHDGLMRAGLVAGWGLLLPLALTSYPSVRWRHPVDFVCLVTLVGAGGTALVWDRPGAYQAPALVVGVALLAHTWWRFEQGGPEDRRPLTWMSLAVGVAGMVAFFVSFSTASEAGTGIAAGLFVAVGPAMYVGLSRPDVIDVRGLVVRAVVLVAAIVVYISVFVLLLALVDAIGGPHHRDTTSPGGVALVGAIAALVFHPTQVLLRGSVEAILFGSRPDPLGAAGLVAGRIGDDPLDALRAIREAMVLPYAAIRRDGADLVRSGIEVAHTRSIPLGEDGELVVGLRPGDLGLSRGDRDVLALVGPLLAQTLRARALASELLDSRGQRVAAVEEERRRLRRDLHDGLGPRLSGIAFTSDAVRNLMRHDPAAAEELLVTLRQETATAISDIRRLVYAMRPPALDELGLVPALRQSALGLRSRDGEVLSVSVNAPEELPALPAAVEVAAYRIVTEALANVARHSAARTASVDLRTAGQGLSIEVQEVGAPASAGSWRAGVGLSSMRERAVELGGTLVAGPSPQGGRVSALLPLAV